jgi:hypothetical protein
MTNYVCELQKFKALVRIEESVEQLRNKMAAESTDIAAL